MIGFKLRQIDIMVTGAQAGDRFFFACWCSVFLHLFMINDRADSGHSGQVPNRHNSEEDGQDECRSGSPMYL
jgi:hypothetical protein